VINQPPQSPDFNVMDLALCNAISKQKDRLQRKSSTLQELVENVKTVFDNFSSDKIERIHAVKYATYREVLKVNGGNQYKVPHSGIRERQKRNDPDHPTIDRKVDAALVASARAAIARMP
jgi:hypothetical protein